MEDVSRRAHRSAYKGVHDESRNGASRREAGSTSRRKQTLLGRDTREIGQSVRLDGGSEKGKRWNVGRCRASERGQGEAAAALAQYWSVVQLL